MSKSINDIAKPDDFTESYDPKSRAAYLRAAQSFNNIAKRCNVKNYESKGILEKIKDFAGLVKMDASILTKYIYALRWGGKFEYEAIAYDILTK